MTFKELVFYLNLLSSFPLVIGAVLYILKYKKLDSLHKAIGVYLLLMLVVEGTGRLLSKLYNNNLILIPIFSFVELTFFMYLYNSYLLKKNDKVLLGVGTIGLIFIVAEFLQYFVFSTLDFKQFQPYSKVADNFIILIMALVFYYQKINSFNETKWTNFKLNTAILAFFTLNTIIFLPFNFIINGSGNAKFYIWIINTMIILLFYIYLTVLIWKNSRSAIAKS